MSIFNNYYRFTTFGESHSQSVGVVIDTPKPNFNLNLDLIQHQLNRRRPGQSNITTPRDEKDKLIVLSGLENNITLGSPLCIIVNNLNVKKEDYVFNESCYIPRPSHADYTNLKAIVNLGYFLKLVARCNNPPSNMVNLPGLEITPFISSSIKNCVSPPSFRFTFGFK